MTFYFGNGSGHLLADRRYDMALQLAKEEDFEAAADLLRQGLELAPHWPPMYFHLGEALRQTNDRAGSEKAFRQYLALDPDDKMGTTIKLTLLNGLPSPETLPTGYVRALFDQYAPRFEQSLVGHLEYHTPELLAKAVLIHRSDFEHLLDLGCGTGLAALQFKGRTKRMSGVDLSPAMIEEAHGKGIYDDLQAMGIEDYLAAPHDPYDLILSADVFVYIGSLGAIFRQIADNLSQDGLYGFSVQETSEGDWVLGEDHRYSHSKPYIESCLTQAGLYILSCNAAVLRKDADHPVPGLIFVAEKA